MIDTSDLRPVSPDLNEALSRNAGADELRQIAKRDFSPEKMVFHLTVGVYSKSQHPAWTHTTINGIEIVLPFWARLALRKWTLDFVDNRFLLRSGDRVKYTLTGR